MTTGLFATEERRMIASFSRPIWALPDGLLVRKGNPKQLTGYRSAAETSGCVVAVVRDQFQHRSAVEFGVPHERISIFETYGDAANAVLKGLADTFASVSRAHSGFLAPIGNQDLQIVPIPFEEKRPAFGSFAFSKSDNALRQTIDDVLLDYLGSIEHRLMMSRFGFSDAEIDLVVDPAL